MKTFFLFYCKKLAVYNAF